MRGLCSPVVPSSITKLLRLKLCSLIFTNHTECQLHFFFWDFGTFTYLSTALPYFFSLGFLKFLPKVPTFNHGSLKQKRVWKLRKFQYPGTFSFSKNDTESMRIFLSSYVCWGKHKSVAQRLKVKMLLACWHLQL